MAHRSFLFMVLSTLSPLSIEAYNTETHELTTSTCGSIKKAFTGSQCCTRGDDAVTDFKVIPMPHLSAPMVNDNPCTGSKPVDAFTPGDGYFKNVECTLEDGVLNALEQSGTEVTKGYKGEINATGREPILTPFYQNGMCPVNVHWHIGTEHKSKGEYDEDGKGPEGPEHRRLSADARKGFQCHHYDSNDPKFTTEYEWQHCIGMKVGETYEVHWPHSAAGDCGTPHQYQTPFYDGVFCNPGIISLNPLNTFKKIGVQAQVFTIVNDEFYFYPDLIRGMLVFHEYGEDVAKYTGSTTGTSRNNEICSRYTPITWQVDRKCHLISASTFDKMCADMKAQHDDMSSDMYAHGARELVKDEFAADNHNRRLDNHVPMAEVEKACGDSLCVTSDGDHGGHGSEAGHHDEKHDAEKHDGVHDGVHDGHAGPPPVHSGPSPAPAPGPPPVHSGPSPAPAPAPIASKNPDVFNENPCWPSECSDTMPSSTTAPEGLAEIDAAAPAERRLLSYMGWIVAAWASLRHH